MIKKAEFIVNWPGQSVHACYRHTLALQGLAAAMSFPLSFDHYDGDSDCTNCVNEAMKMNKNPDRIREPKRWTAVAIFREEPKIEYQFDEFWELGTWMEQGPHWGALERLVVTYNFSEGKTLAQLSEE